MKNVQFDSGWLAVIRTGAAGRFAAVAGMLTLLAVAPVSAQEGLKPRFSFGGFGTLGLIHSGEDGADFVENTMRSSGPGHSGAVNASLDSRIAGQASVSIGAKLTAVLQVMVEHDVDGNYAPSAEWANLSYGFTSDLSVRGGRIVLPAFLVSDSRKVAYANPWVRPPVELYGLAPVYSLDGVDATYRRRLGEWTGSVNGAFGRTRSAFPGGEVEADRLWNVNALVVRGDLTGRLAITGGRLHIDQFRPLFDGFRAFGAEGVAIADRFDADNRDLHLATAGIEYDPGTWFTIAEAGWFESHSVLGQRMAAYVTSGFRWATLSPYVTYSRTTLLSEASVAGLTVSNLPPAHAQAAAELNAGLNAILNTAPAQQNLGLGGRWDFTPGAVLKAQVEFVDILGTSYGTFINMQPGFEPGGSALLFSVATAFVF